MRTKTGRGGGFARQWRIYQTLLRQPDGVRVVSLANAVGCSRRTVYRDIAVMIDAGVPVYEHPDGPKMMVYRLVD